MMLMVYGFCSRLELGFHRIIRAKANQIVVIRNHRNPRSQIDRRQASALSRVTSSPKSHDRIKHVGKLLANLK